MPLLAYRRVRVLWDARYGLFYTCTDGWERLPYCSGVQAVWNVKCSIREFSVCQRVGQKSRKTMLADLGVWDVMATQLQTHVWMCERHRPIHFV